MASKYNQQYNTLVNLFFILSFLSITYKYNIYVILLLVIGIFAISKKFKTSLSIILPLFLIPIIYFIEFGFNEFYRVEKTLLMIIPIGYIIYYFRLKVSKILIYFVNINVAFIYIEFILYHFLGITIFPDTTNTLGLLRHHAFFEDSNFFSYVLIAFIIYNKIISKKYNIFYIIALFISLSVSAIIIFFILIFGLYIHQNYFKGYQKFIRIVAFVLTSFFVVLYYFAVMNNDKIQNLSDNPFVKFKLVSMSIRFDVQKKAINTLIEKDSLLFGLGAGSARKLNDRNLNLHNTFLQIFVEIGLIGLLFVVVFCIFILFNIHIYFVSLWSVFILLGNIMEVFYFPLLLFIFFLSNSYISKKGIKDEVFINNSNIR